MRIFLGLAFSAFAVPAIAVAELSEGEEAWGKAARQCLSKEGSACKVILKEEKLKIWCPAKTPKNEADLQKCDDAADAAMAPKEWTPKK